MLISQYSSRQMVEKHETCTCVAVEIKIKIKIVGGEKSRVLYSKSRHLLTTEEKRT